MKKIITIITGTIVLVLVGFTIVMSAQQEVVSAKNTETSLVNRENVKKVPSNSQLVAQNDQDSTETETEESQQTTNIEKEDNKVVEETRGNNTTEESTIKELTHHKIIELTDGVTKTLNSLLAVEALDEDLRLIHYHSKAEVEQLFLQYVKPGVADPYIDQYFEERNGVLYGLPQDGPYWFEKEIEYTLEEQANNKYILTQTITESDLYGPYSINLEFEFADNQWKISRIQVN